MIPLAAGRPRLEPRGSIRRGQRRALRVQGVGRRRPAAGARAVRSLGGEETSHVGPAAALAATTLGRGAEDVETTLHHGSLRTENEKEGGDGRCSLKFTVPPELRIQDFPLMIIFKRH